MRRRLFSSGCPGTLVPKAPDTSTDAARRHRHRADSGLFAVHSCPACVVTVWRSFASSPECTMRSCSRSVEGSGRSARRAYHRPVAGHQGDYSMYVCQLSSLLMIANRDDSLYVLVSLANTSHLGCTQGSSTDSVPRPTASTPHIPSHLWYSYFHSSGALYLHSHIPNIYSLSQFPL